MSKEQHHQGEEGKKENGPPVFPPLHGPETGMETQDEIDKNNEELNLNAPI